MTLNMPDSTTPAHLPSGYPAYLGYVDGDWPTAASIRARFPGAQILTLTVLGADAIADGCDRETGDLTAATAAEWLHLAIIAGQHRPVLYASRDNVEPVLDMLGDAHVDRAQIRILTAHYAAGQHICSPQACGATFTADGTQWTDVFPGAGGALIDMSLLAGDFFSPSATAAVAADWQETTMQQLPVIEEGATGQTVRTIQALCIARGHTVTVDGSFGALTAAAVKAVQAAAKVPADGVVGPATWPLLLGV